MTLFSHRDFTRSRFDNCALPQQICGSPFAIHGCPFFDIIQWRVEPGTSSYYGYRRSTYCMTKVTAGKMIRPPDEQPEKNILTAGEHYGSKDGSRTGHFESRFFINIPLFFISDHREASSVSSVINLSSMSSFLKQIPL